MIKLTVLSAALLIYSSLVSQNMSIKQGQEFVPENKDVFNYYIDKDASGVYIARTSTKGKGITKIIQKLDAATLTQVYSVNYSLDKGEEVTDVFLKKNKILVFTNLFAKDEQTEHYLLREFDCKTGNMIGERKEVASIPTTFRIKPFNVTFSPDESKMAVICNVPEAGQPNRASAIIYETTGFRKMGTKPIIELYHNSTIRSFNYRVDNTGNFYYLFNYTKNFEEQISGLAIAHIPQNDTRSSITPLPFDNMAIQNGIFEFVNNDLVLCGLFKDAPDKSNKFVGPKGNLGVFIMSIEGKSGTVKYKDYDYFPQEVKDKLSYEQGLIHKNPFNKFYSFEEIIPVGESIYLIESHSYGFSSNGAYAYATYEREFIVSKFTKDGKLEWMKVIPKYTLNKLNNFNYLVRNNKLYLFYAESPKNMETTTVGTYDPLKYVCTSAYNGSVLVCTSIDEYGNLERKEVFRNEGWCYDPISTNVVLDKDNGMLLRMINKDKERYDKITFD